MIGTLLNVAGILIGGIAGLYRRRTLSPGAESNLRVILGAFTVYYGLRLTWLSLGGSLGHIFKQVFIAVLALILGKLAGRSLRLQSMSNHLGRAARQRIDAARPEDPSGLTCGPGACSAGTPASAGGTTPKRRLSEGFKVCATLFCAAPLGLVGALEDGLCQYFYPLGVKAAMDGLATMSFVRVFGPGAMVSALPVLAFQGTITLGSRQFLSPFLEGHNLADSVNAVGGLLVFSVALVVLGLKKIHLADYLPSLALAPLLTWLWK
jgi:uncharacterized membrane protein YqgA involved in biofilm formation